MTEPVTTRVQQVREAMAAAPADRQLTHLLVTHLGNVRWLTGFTGSAGRVLIGPEGPPVLVTDDRYTLRAAQEAPGARLVIDRTWGWLPEEVADAVIGVEAAHMPWATVSDLQELLADAGAGPADLVPTTGLVDVLRAVKDEGEIALIERACQITADAYDALLGWVSPGTSEAEVARFLFDTMRDGGADGEAFAPIVASGPNGAIPHHSPGGRRLATGDLVTVDFGALVGGMHADMTRTFAIGEPPVEMRRIHDLVRTAQQAGVEAVAAGVATAAVDEACRTVIAASGHREHFSHGTGHGVGLQIHEEPFLGPRTPGVLEEGMTITVEPGIYVPDVGGVRIEDVVLVGAEQGVRLTNAPRELIVV